MNYGIEWSSGAWRAFRELDLDAEEDVLDLVERLAADVGPLPPGGRLPPRVVHHLWYDGPSGLSYILIDIEYDVARSTLTVIELAHQRLRGPP